MNKAYRLVWSACQQTWVAVAEFTRARGKSGKAGGVVALAPRSGPLMLALLAGGLAHAGPAADALPTGGQIVAGNGSIAQSGSAMTVTQGSQRMIANWQSFDIGANASVHFAQPSASAIALNRVVGQDPSQIFGQLTSNGQVMLVNPSGIVFGAGSQVNVGGLVASTLNISDAQFMAGQYSFSGNGNGTGSIVNQGRITTPDGGVVAFIAPVVKNEGQIETPKGSTLLAAGKAVDIDFAGDGLLTYRIDGGAASALVENTGSLSAEGGNVILTARAADSLAQAAVNNSGIVAAKGMVNRNGRIVLAGDIVVQSGTVDVSSQTQGGTIQYTARQALVNTGAAKATGQQGGEIRAEVRNGVEAGQWDVSGSQAGGRIDYKATGAVEQTAGSRFKADGAVAGDLRLTAGESAWLSGHFSAQGGQGGKISVTAPDLVLAGAKLKADGNQGGGRIRVGGGWQGGDADLTNARTTRVSASSELSASALDNGNGGQVVVWSQENTGFSGKIDARGGAQGGNGGEVEVSSHDRLTFSGEVSTAAPQGMNGKLLLDPRNITINNGTVSLTYANFGSNDNHGIGGVVELTNGNIVVASPLDGRVATGGGAVRLYRQDGTLLATLAGSSAYEYIGQGGVTALTNGNYVVRSIIWKNGSATSAGAVTWGNGTTGISGTVSVANSLVGGSSNDSIGGHSVVALPNGNYVVISTGWGGGSYTNAGAVTWGNGNGGTVGVVSAANSLVGGTNWDQVGNGGITVLTNGNYVVSSNRWNNPGVATLAGAATWGNGTTGISGLITAANSLVGTSSAEQVGSHGIIALTNGNYVVNSPYWDNAAVYLGGNAGAVTWGDGATGITGAISAANSLVGVLGGNTIGSGGVTALANGHYVVSSENWSSGGSTGSLGAVTWGNGSTGIKGSVSAANSLVGTANGNQVGNGGVVALSNGNFVVRSWNWDNGAVKDVGAVTWANGSAAVVGTVSAANSLIGTTTNDRVGFDGVTALTNGNYVVRSSVWDSGAIADVGAVTWGNGTTGTVGTVSAANSLVGSSASDQVGSTGVTALSNGHYVVASSNWDNGGIVDAGAVTWGNGNGGTVGTLSAANSLVGSTATDKIGSGGVTALKLNGNYVVASSGWDNSGIVDAGAVTWGNGATGVVGTISAANSLVGSTANDKVGSDGITALTKGDYVVRSYNWDYGASTDRSAVTWGDGSKGTLGVITASNSIIGGAANEKLGDGGILALANGNYVISSPKAAGAAGTVILVSNYMANPLTYADNPGWDNAISVHRLKGLLDAGTNVTLQASNDITVDQAIAVNNAGGNGGNLTLQAGRSILVNANITTDNGNLALIGNDTLANGVVDGDRAAGNAVITMASGTSIDAGTGTVAIHLRDGAGRTHTGSGDIKLRNITAGTLSVVNQGPTAGSGVTLQGTLTASGAGDAIVLAGKDFVNNAGAAALSANNGRWLVWSGDPGADTRGGLAYGFKHYNATYGVTAVAGAANQNGFLYTLAPTVTAGLTGTVTKTYDGLKTAALTAANYTVTGAIDGDTVIISTPAAGTYADKNVGVGKTVDVTGVAVTGASNGGATVYGYGIAAANISGVIGTITKKAITAEGIGANHKVYDGGTVATLNTGGATFTAGGVVAGDTLALDFTGASGTFVDKNVGNGKAVTISGLGLSGTDAGNYTVTDASGVKANITPKAITAQGINAQDKVYDRTTAATLNTAGAALAAGGVIAGDTVSLEAAGAAGAFADRNVGNAKAVTVTGLTLSGGDAGNYTVSDASGAQASITPKAITAQGITANHKIYDRTTTASLNTGAATLVASGVIAGDTVALNAGGATGAFADKNVGNAKTVTVTGLGLTGADAGNYTVTDASGAQADITPKVITAKGITAQNKVYDRTTATTLNTAGAVLAAGGVVAGDTVSLVTAGAAGAFADKNVGNGKAVTVTGLSLSGADAGNYTVSDASGAQANITPKAITAQGITANHKVYDGATAASLNTGTATLAAGGVIAGDTVGLNAGAATGAFADKNVGNLKTVTVAGLTLSGADAGNYTVSDVSGAQADITPKAITAQGITAHSKVYDRSTAASLNTAGATLAAGGVVAGDTVSLVTGGATGSFADKNVGMGKAVTVAGLALAGADAGNYTVSDASSAQANITARTLATGLTAATKVYDGSTAATVAFTDDRIAGDALAIGHAAANFDTKNVGAGKTVTATGLALSGADAGNYVLASPNAKGIGAIAAKALTIQGVAAQNKVYDGTTVATIDAASAVFAPGGLVAGDTVTLGTGGAAGTFVNKNVGVGKTVTIAGLTLSGADAANYTLTSGSATTTADITAKALTARGITAQNKVYDRTTAATLNTAGAALAAGGVVAGDTVSLVTAGAAGAFADRNVGNGKAVTVTGLSLSGGDAGNYTVSDASGTVANITPKAITAQGISTNHKVYDGATAASLNTGAATLTAGGVIAGDTVALDTGAATGAFADKNVGNAKAVTVAGLTLSGADAGNYTVSDASGAQANITPKAITAQGITAHSKVYDRTTAASLNIAGATLAAGGVVAGDTVSLVAGGATGSFADKNLGIGKAVTVAGLALAGADAGNYTVSDASGAQANITARTLATGLTAATKVYDGTTAATVTFTDDRLAGDALAIGHFAANFDTKNVGAGKTVTATGLALSGADAGNYVLASPNATGTGTITAKALTIQGVAAQNKVYDGTTAATIDAASAVFAPGGLVAGDTVALGTGGATGTFADKNVGVGKTVTIAGLSLYGADAANYTLTSGSANATANITAKALTVQGLMANSKVYDGTTAASLNAAAAGLAAGGVVAGDAVALAAGAASGSFADKNVGNGKTVTVRGLSLAGADAGNYTLTPYTTTADINRRPVTLSGSKVYDGHQAFGAGAFTLANVVLGEQLGLTGSGSVQSKAVSAGLQAVELGSLVLADGPGAASSNYVLVGGSARVAPKPLLLAFAAQDKRYDANTSALVTVSDNRLAGDDVSLQYSASFADANPGMGKEVRIGDLRLTGADAANYVLAVNEGRATASINGALPAIRHDVPSVAPATNLMPPEPLSTRTLSEGTLELGGQLGNRAVAIGLNGDTATVISNGANLISFADAPSMKDMAVLPRSLPVFAATNAGLSAVGTLVIREQSQFLSASSLSQEGAAPALPAYDAASLRQASALYRSADGREGEVTVGLSDSGVLQVQVPLALRQSLDHRALVLLGLNILKLKLNADAASVVGLVIKGA